MPSPLRLMILCTSRAPTNNVAMTTPSTEVSHKPHPRCTGPSAPIPTLGAIDEVVQVSKAEAKWFQRYGRCLIQRRHEQRRRFLWMLGRGSHIRSNHPQLLAQKKQGWSRSISGRGPSERNTIPRSETDCATNKQTCLRWTLCAIGHGCCSRR